MKMDRTSKNSRASQWEGLRCEGLWATVHRAVPQNAPVRTVGEVEPLDPGPG